jgi:hypothetical protein
MLMPGLDRQNDVPIRQAFSIQIPIQASAVKLTGSVEDRTSRFMNVGIETTPDEKEQVSQPVRTSGTTCAALLPAASISATT